MNEIVERLRACATHGVSIRPDTVVEATDEIEKLREQHDFDRKIVAGRNAEIERLRALVVAADREIKTSHADADRVRDELRNEREGKISQSYAAELARQVGELEAENEQLRARFVPEIDAASE